VDKGIVDLNRFGEIVVDAKARTTPLAFFAAGDSTTAPYKQIINRAREGA